MGSDIQIAASDEEIMATYGVMSQLRPHIQPADYLPLVRLLEAEVGFQLAALGEGGRIICVAGFRLCRSLGWGKYLYVDDLVTDGKQRSKGAGKAMLHWLVERARAEGCDELCLDTALYRKDAHRFYDREQMEFFCRHYRRVLKESQSRKIPEPP